MGERSGDLLSENAGFTLVEMLVAMVLSVIILSAAVMVFTAAIRSQPRVNSQASAIQQARTTMERLVRELRQGSGLVAGTTASASSVSIVTYVPTSCTGAASATATQCSVTYTCTGTPATCTRRVARPDGTLPGAPVQVVSGLSSPNIFTYSPTATAPTYLGVTLAFPTEGGANAITLSDGAELRNAVVAG
jgi:prepilin-type N-terminal cleavage/methylation domain-containing protein